MPANAAKQGPSKQKFNLEIHYLDELPVKYSNHVNFFVTNWDVAMDFGLMRSETLGPGKPVKALIETRIIMSPQHAKQFVNKLSNLLEEYEKDFGPLQTEPKAKKSK